MWDSAIESLRSFWEALKAAQAPLQAAVVAASVSVLVALVNTWLQLRQQNRQHKLSLQLETFRLTANEKSRWFDDRRRDAFEKLEAIRDSLANAVSGFRDLAKGSEVWDDHEMVEHAPEALLSLGAFLSAFSKGKQDVAEEFVKICSEARVLFTETFLLLSVQLETRRKRKAEIESRVEQLIQARERFEDHFKRYERDPWDWNPAKDSDQHQEREP